MGHYFNPLSKAKNKYQNKKRESIKLRNISFNLTFDEWYTWFFIRGVDKNLPSTSSNMLCMCRFNDTGPYELGNIYLATKGQNSKDHHKFNPQPPVNEVKCCIPVGVFNSIKEASIASGIHQETLKYRFKSPNFPEYYRL